MIDKFLQAKHWQLFLLVFGIPFIFQIVLMVILFSSISRGNEPNPEILFSYFKFIPLLMILFYGVYFGWFYSVGVGLQKKIPDDLKLMINRFKLFLFFPPIYMVLFSFFIFSAFTSVFNNGTEPNLNLVGLIIPLHLFTMFCMFYTLYFVAKTIKTAELQRKVSFGDFAGEFFLIWFFPNGVWIVQPKINKIFGEGFGNDFIV